MTPAKPAASGRTARTADRRQPDAEGEALQVGSDETLLQSEAHRFGHEARRLAAGGWQRALLGVVMGAVLGAAAAVGLPREG